MSNVATPTEEPSRRARSTSIAARSSKPRRLSTPVSLSMRASAASRATRRSLRSDSARTTTATIATETTTSNQLSNRPPEWISAAPWTIPTQATIAAVPRRPKKYDTHRTGQM
jgi:hypothetical protein